MSAPLRFFVPATLVSGLQVALPREVVQHLLVRRVAPGERVTLFNGHGGEFIAEISRLDKHEAIVLVHDAVDREAELPYSIVLAQSISSTDRMDFTIAKAVELGVSSIVPLTSTRNVVRLNEQRAERRHAHWLGIIRAACEQCGRNTLPALQSVVTLERFLASHRAQLKLIASPQARRPLVDVIREASIPNVGQSTTLLVGPEGGFDDKEQARAIDAGFVPISLGPRVLRTETAGPAALAMIQAIWGQ